jgi:glycosyltransferase involved in cell wall biosynthesis
VNTWREVEAAGAGFVEDDTVAGTRRLLQRWLGSPGPERAAMRERARACYERHFRIEGAAARLAALVRALRAPDPAASGARMLGGAPVARAASPSSQ